MPVNDTRPFVRRTYLKDAGRVIKHRPGSRAYNDWDTTPVLFRMWFPIESWEGGKAVDFPGGSRRWKGGRAIRGKGELIALFPCQAGDNDPYTCQSFQHVGQHGAADLRGIMAASRPATPAEYAPLQSELEGRGYVLAIRQRTPINALAMRKAELER